MVPGGVSRAALLAAALLLVVSQWRAIRTENINWDEFAFLGRVHSSIQSGKLNGGGRPGLAAVMLVPFVADCHSSVDAVVAARKLWLGFTVAYLAAVFVLVLQSTPNREYAREGAALAVAL